MQQDAELCAAVALRDLILAGESYRMVLAQCHGLGVTETHALCYLARDGDLGQSALTVRLGITTGAVTALVDRLERRGLVVRLAHESDRRRSIVSLTPSAHELVEGADRLLAQVFVKLPAERAEGAVQLVQELAGSLAQQTEDLRSTELGVGSQGMNGT